MKICLVIPCFNEEKRLLLAEYAVYYAEHPDTSLFFVDDGSADNTLSMLTSLAKSRDDRVSIVSLPHNAGKAEAVRVGILHALRDSNFEYIGFMDADLATPFSEIDSLISCCTKSPDSAIVFGSRIKRSGARITRSPIRYYLGRVFAAAAMIFFGIPAFDTQCGAKLIRASIAVEICSEPFLSRWLFDVELFLRAIALPEVHMNSMIEFPLVEWAEKGNSRLRMKDVVKIISDFVSIRKKYGHAVRQKHGAFVQYLRSE